MTTSPFDDTDLRDLLDDLIAALMSHFHAVRNRRDEADPDVQAAYTRLRAAAEQYDDMLFELTGEVTPWEFPAGPPSDIEYEDRAAAPDAVTVMVRRDYGIADPAGLLLAGREAYADLYPDDPDEAAAADVSHPGRALYQLLQAYGVDGLDSRAEAAGLAPRGGTVWVQALSAEDAETLTAEPFEVADEGMLIYRLDEVINPPDSGEEPL
ncbi:MAG TPA: hypothetical protein VFR23_22045 [Jiangellaceae bacterium]|nr:hypothetical protein [Jiangellaceae bacterium]